MAEPQKIRVLYFDKSAGTMQKFIDSCSSKSIIELVGVFSSFNELAPVLERGGCGFLKALSPTVIVLRLDPPWNSYLKYLPLIKSGCAVKTIGILPEKYKNNKEITGALDYYIESPSSAAADSDVYEQLIYKIKTARLMLNAEKASATGKWVPLPKRADNSGAQCAELVAIGASAGGTEAVSRVLTGLPADFLPVLVVQHIPENFTEFFSHNLAGKISMKVQIARGGEKLEKGSVYIAGNDRHLEVVRDDDGNYYTRCTRGGKVSGHRPSVDVLFASAASAAGSAAVGVILTGMGSDGAHGLLEMRRAGAYTIGQNRESSAVYGMPMAAYNIGAVAKQLPLNKIADEIVRTACNAKRGTADEQNK